MIGLQLLALPGARSLGSHKNPGVFLATFPCSLQFPHTPEEHVRVHMRMYAPIVHVLTGAPSLRVLSFEGAFSAVLPMPCVPGCQSEFLKWIF